MRLGTAGGSEEGGRDEFWDFGRLAGKVPPLVPGGVKVVLLADRGFADTQLMKLITQMGWHFRIRIKANFWVYQPDKPRCQVRNFYLSKGQTVFLHGVSITDKQHGPVHLALVYHSSHDEYWYLVSSEPTNCQTFVEYGLRFDIEENFLDDKSNGFQLEKSAIRNADALCRLCLVLAMTTLFLVSTGTQVVACGKRRWVDPHWFRGSSYLRIGWQWIKAAWVKGWQFYSRLVLIGGPDPEPAIASRKQATSMERDRLNLSYYYSST